MFAPQRGSESFPKSLLEGLTIGFGFTGGCRGGSGEEEAIQTAGNLLHLTLLPSLGEPPSPYLSEPFSPPSRRWENYVCVRLIQQMRKISGWAGRKGGII